MAGVIVAATALISACTAASAARSSAKVPLEVPEPPPRAEIRPVPAADITAPQQPSLPAPSVPITAPPVAAPSTAAATLPPPATPSPVVASPEPARPAPPPELRPSGPAGLTRTAAQVREAIGRTKQKLDLIDRRRLNAGKQADYDSARRFLSQAENAVTANNLLLAQSSAEKAETLADGLR